MLALSSTIPTTASCPWSRSAGGKWMSLLTYLTKRSKWLLPTGPTRADFFYVNVSDKSWETIIRWFLTRSWNLLSNFFSIFYIISSHLLSSHNPLIRALVMLVPQSYDIGTSRRPRPPSDHTTTTTSKRPHRTTGLATNHDTATLPRRRKGGNFHVWWLFFCVERRRISKL